MSWCVFKHPANKNEFCAAILLASSSLVLLDLVEQATTHGPPEWMAIEHSPVQTSLVSAMSMYQVALLNPLFLPFNQKHEHHFICSLCPNKEWRVFQPGDQRQRESFSYNTQSVNGITGRQLFRTGRNAIMAIQCMELLYVALFAWILGKNVLY